MRKGPSMPPDFKGLWSIAWRVFLLGPIVVPLGFLVLTLAIASLVLPPFYCGIRVFSGDYFLAALVATGWLIWLRFASWVLKPVLENWRDDG